MKSKFNSPHLLLNVLIHTLSVLCLTLPLNAFSESRIVSDQYVIVSAASDFAVEALYANSSSVNVKTIGIIGDKKFILASKAAAQLKRSLKTFDPRKDTIFCSELRNVLSNSVSCEVNWLYRSFKTPDDPRFDEQWGLSFINAETAWNSSTGSDDVTVAIIDSGIDYNHPDLAQNIWINSEEIPGNNIDDDGNGYTDDIYGYDFFTGNGDAIDSDGHGTHVAGIVGAVSNNSLGISGLNWQVKLMALKVEDAQGNIDLASAIEALAYASDNGAQLINASWGGEELSSALRAAIDSANILFVAAAGNETNNNDLNPVYPASYNLSNILSVAANNSEGSLSEFSNYGAGSVDIAAPGSSILSTLPGGNFGFLSGTSMAAPFISGAAALYLSVFPSASPAEIKEKIIDSASESAGLNSKVVADGYLDLESIFDNKAPPTPTPEISPTAAPSPSATPVSGGGGGGSIGITPVSPSLVAYGRSDKKRRSKRWNPRFLFSLNKFKLLVTAEQNSLFQLSAKLVVKSGATHTCILPAYTVKVLKNLALVTGKVPQLSKNDPLKSITFSMSNNGANYSSGEVKIRLSKRAKRKKRRAPADISITESCADILVSMKQKK